MTVFSNFVHLSESMKNKLKSKNDSQDVGIVNCVSVEVLDFVFSWRFTFTEQQNLNLAHQLTHLV